MILKLEFYFSKCINPFAHQYPGCPHPLQIHCSLNCPRLCLTGVRAPSQCCLHRCSQWWPFFQPVCTAERRIYKYTCLVLRSETHAENCGFQSTVGTKLREIHTSSFHLHLVSAGHRRARPDKSGIGTAPQRLWEEDTHVKQT